MKARSEERVAVAAGFSHHALLAADGVICRGHAFRPRRVDDGNHLEPAIGLGSRRIDLFLQRHAVRRAGGNRLRESAVSFLPASLGAPALVADRRHRQLSRRLPDQPIAAPFAVRRRGHVEGLPWHRAGQHGGLSPVRRDGRTHPGRGHGHPVSAVRGFDGASMRRASAARSATSTLGTPSVRSLALRSPASCCFRTSAPRVPWRWPRSFTS